MKTCISTLILIGSLLITSLSYSQVYRYIEISATETVTLKSTQIIYEISFVDEYKWGSMKIDMPDSDDSPPANIDGITKLLSKGKFNYSLVHSENYSISKTKDDPKIEVILKDENELKRLYDLLKGESGFNGSIKDVQYESISNYQEDLFKRLYENALQQATKMAIISGGKVGMMVSVTESTSAIDESMGFYEKLMKQVGKGMFAIEGLTEKEEEITMMYVFELL